MIVNGSVVNMDNKLYLVFGILSYMDFSVRTILSNLNLKAVQGYTRDSLKKEILTTGFIYILFPYREDMFDSIMPNDYLTIKDGTFLPYEIKRIDKKTLDLWLTKSKLQSFYIRENFPDVYDIEEVRKERLSYMKEYWYDFIPFLVGAYEQKPCKRVTKNMMYSYRIKNIVFYAIALGDGKFLNLGTRPYNVVYYLDNRDTITLKGETLYNTGVNCSFIKDL